MVRSAPTGGAFAGRTGPAVPRLYDPDAPADPAPAPPPVPVPDLQELAGDLADLSTGFDEPEATADPVPLREPEPHKELEGKNRLAAIGAPSYVVEDKTPVPTDAVHGEYGISRASSPPPRPPPPDDSGRAWAPQHVVEDKTPIPAESFDHGPYSITKKE